LESTIQNYTGSYTGLIEGVSSTLNISQEGTSIQGELHKGNFIHNLVGVVINNSIRGRLSGTESIESYVLVAEYNDDALQIDLILHDIHNGVTESNSYSFRMINTAASVPVIKQDITESTDPSVIDPQIIGIWARDELFNRSDITVNTKLLIELSDNGNYNILGANKLQGHKDTGYSGDTTTGKWKTKNKVFYILVSGSKHWKPYAKYQLDNNKMVFVLGDGERQEWSRIIKDKE